jgi:imidazolonepropionase-like amidohydrolase
MPRRTVRRLLLIAAAASPLMLLAAIPAVPQNPPPYFAIRGARIVTGGGPVIENGTVVIANGLIAAVGTDIAIPPEAWVIEGHGLTVYPGLIDALTDLGLPTAQPQRPAQQPAGPPAPPQRPAQGPEDRPASTPWVVAADELNAEDRRFESWRNAGFTTVLTTPQQGIFSGQGAVVNTAGARTSEMVVQAPATLHITFRSPGGFREFPGSLMGTLAYIKQVFLDAEHYGRASAVYERTRRGVQRPGYDRTERVVHEALAAGRPVFLPANTAVEIHRALHIARQIGLRKYVLYGGQQGYQVAGTLAEAKVPVLVSLRWPERDREADPEAPESLRSLRFRDRAPSTPAALHRAGVPFAFYSDGITNPRDLLKNVAKAVEAGLPREAAIRALTLDAAEILGVADRLGSIEAGKMANLVVTDGDLLDEKTKLKLVFVDGRRFEVRESARPAEPPRGNLAGRWSLTVNTPQGSQQVTAELSMAPDGTLTGTVTSPMGTATVSHGWLSGNRFSFTISLAMGPQQVEATFSGTVEGNRMSGTVSFGGFTAEFTGTRPDTSVGSAE